MTGIDDRRHAAHLAAAHLRGRRRHRPVPAGARRDPAGRARGAQRRARRAASASTTASRRRTRSSPIRKSRSSARPRRSCSAPASPYIVASYAVQRSRQSDLDRQDQGVREDDGRAGRRPDPRCRDPRARRLRSHPRTDRRDVLRRRRVRFHARSRICTRRWPRSGPIRPRRSSRRSSPARPLAIAR